MKDEIIEKQAEMIDLYKKMARNYRELYYETPLNTDKIKDDNDDIRIKIKQIETKLKNLKQLIR